MCTVGMKLKKCLFAKRIKREHHLGIEIFKALTSRTRTDGFRIWILLKRNSEIVKYQRTLKYCQPQSKDFKC